MDTRRPTPIRPSSPSDLDPEDTNGPSRLPTPTRRSHCVGSLSVPPLHSPRTSLDRPYLYYLCLRASARSPVCVDPLPHPLRGNPSRDFPTPVVPRDPPDFVSRLSTPDNRVHTPPAPPLGSGLSSARPGHTGLDVDRGDTLPPYRLGSPDGPRRALHGPGYHETLPVPGPDNTLRRLGP